MAQAKLRVSKGLLHTLLFPGKWKTEVEILDIYGDTTNDDYFIFVLGGSEVPDSEYTRAIITKSETTIKLEPSG